MFFNSYGEIFGLETLQMLFYSSSVLPWVNWNLAQYRFPIAIPSSVKGLIFSKVMKTPPSFSSL